MKQLSVQQQLINCKYPYPCTVYDKDGGVISRRTVTHNLKASKELTKLYPRLAAFINTYEDEEVVKKPGTVKELMNSLGK